ncbi:hypothetical protein ACFE04_023868 [Oxalis oulophora]
MDIHWEVLLQITVLVLNQSGEIERLIWEDSDWYVLYKFGLNLPCQNYSYCAANSICRLSKTHHCECLDGFVPESTDKHDQVCKRRLPLDCGRAKGDKFQKFQNVELPDLLDVWIDEDMSLVECNAKCLMNCSCTAFSNSDIGTGCSMWFGDIIDFKEVGKDYRGQDVYIRVPTPNSGTESSKADMEVLHFDFATISAATENFSNANVLGVGGFGLVYKAWLLWRENRALELMDACLVGESCIEYQIHRCIHIGLLCVQKFSDDRPAMSSVLNMLANEETTLPKPKVPGFFIERSYEQEGTSHSIHGGSTSDSGKGLTITLEGR